MSRSAVSVVIPTRDRLPLLQQAIASVRTQTFTDWDVVVVDDVSSDGTREWLASLDDPRVRALALERHGQRLAACNRALAEPLAELVMFLDDDDRLRPDALRLLVAALRARPDAVAAVGAKWRYREWGDGVRIHHARRRAVRTIWPELLFGWSAVSGQMLYRTEAVRAAGGFPAEHPIVDDRALWLRVARLGPVVLEPSVVLDYRVHDGQRRPDDILARREAVWASFLADLPPADRARGERIRRGAAAADRAGDELRRGRHRAALGSYLRALGAAPSLWLSPLAGPPLRWGARRSLRGLLARP